MTSNLSPILLLWLVLPYPQLFFSYDSPDFVCSYCFYASFLILIISRNYQLVFLLFGGVMIIPQVSSAALQIISLEHFHGFLMPFGFNSSPVFILCAFSLSQLLYTPMRNDPKIFQPICNHCLFSGSVAIQSIIDFHVLPFSSLLYLN